MPNPSELQRMEEAWDEPRRPDWADALERLTQDQLLELIASKSICPAMRAWAENLYRHGQRVEARF